MGYWPRFQRKVLDKYAESMHNARMSHAQRVQILGDVCFVRAYAKINLTLDVTGRRTDGYHELVTVMQAVDLHDTLCLTATRDGRVRVDCTRSELNNEENLAAQAARLLRERFALSQGVLIELRKSIPVAAGLGGGSSDAAAALLALRQWWRLPLSLSELQAMAATLGSDVPFFLTGGLALCEGRGERVTPLAAQWPSSMRWLLLLKPAISISTASVFRRLPASDYTDGSHSRALVGALQEGRLPRLEDFHNGLERSVLELYPEVARAKADLLQAGAPLVRLSGSGPTLYAPFPDLSSATRAREQLRTPGYELYLARAVSSTGGDIDVL
ncbi:MAG TPA: 4-(cytidine 5'-diphospho)-2-C-methyl-D-erythritol kinase [Ktedonobacteraceae bacterium]|nr:4-(cytidine 5'-diphospho)-2-C-methyl-D-erythritol kinase [Ktedonobacteraceae bacterium]